ncbi:hypothetical protein BU24DRAFT_448163 [Aaosphaeria arxii CBS 175.79]|uniref:Uncharacterized protein n=1 Tax=Aaosphaeria arxii CBS 175.79 TaxID=1450172 RepID=A0A6A5Y4L2_9PLEO|nr:uncharacterized protein BU24DRAFT_448163 [Aaosphaeria arxii CBS 175.79]KAF2019730.1 hypothetical protein BU24DRAFT_448163 [Aaosphaeria arxii CBS 175.79]
MDSKLKHFKKKNLSAFFDSWNETATSDKQHVQEYGSFPTRKDDLFTHNNANQIPEGCSPGRRLRLMGSIRKLRSSLDLSRIVAQGDASPDASPRSVRSRNSLPLGFNLSPPTRVLSGSGSFRSRFGNSSITHSSPIAVSASTRIGPDVGKSTPPSTNTFEVGTVPVSPSPLTEPAVQKSIIINARPNPFAHSLTNGTSVVSNGNLSSVPLPRNSLPLVDGKTPDIVLSPASPTSGNLDYFSLPDTKLQISDESPNTACIFASPFDGMPEKPPVWPLADNYSGSFNLPLSKTTPILTSNENHYGKSRPLDTGDQKQSRRYESSQVSEANTIESLRRDADVSAYLALDALHNESHLSATGSNDQGNSHDGISGIPGALDRPLQTIVGENSTQARLCVPEPTRIAAPKSTMSHVGDEITTADMEHSGSSGEQASKSGPERAFDEYVFSKTTGLVKVSDLVSADSKEQEEARLLEGGEEDPETEKEDDALHDMILLHRVVNNSLGG